MKPLDRSLCPGDRQNATGTNEENDLLDGLKDADFSHQIAL